MSLDLVRQLRPVKGEVEADWDFSVGVVGEEVMNLHVSWVEYLFESDIVRVNGRLWLLLVRIGLLEVLVLWMKDEVCGGWERGTWVVSWRIVDLWWRS